MYRGFNLNLENADIDEAYGKLAFDIGANLIGTHKDKVETVIESFLNESGRLDASKMQASWFPIIDCDVFISHSHKDEDLAVQLAGWLYANFELESFIDSCVWGYSNDLIKLIDDTYCRKQKGGNYDYEKRNASTSHVHMMLSTALSKMIDRSECVIFLNTPRSIAPTDVIPNDKVTTTLSPWIYSEISMTKLIRKRMPDDHRGLIKKSTARLMNERLQELFIDYQVDLNHLSELNKEDLNNWLNVSSTNKHDALDNLYKLKPLKTWQL